MKCRMTLSIAFVLGLALASVTAAYAQNQLRPIADSGVVTLGPGQEVRVTVAAGDVNGDDNIGVRFRQIEYNMCNASPKLCVTSQTTSNMITLTPGEAASYNLGDTGTHEVGVRGVVLSNRPDAKVVMIVFDTATQRVVSQIAMTKFTFD